MVQTPLAAVLPPTLATDTVSPVARLAVLPVVTTMGLTPAPVRPVTLPLVLGKTTVPAPSLVRLAAGTAAGLGSSTDPVTVRVVPASAPMDVALPRMTGATQVL